MEDGQPASRASYQQSGPVTVRGILRLPHVPRFAGVPDPTLAPGETRLDAWNAIHLERIRDQVPYPLLPVYIQAAGAGVEVAAAPGADAQSADAARYPIGGVDQPDLSEGPHLGYAFQWFIFAALLGGGYPYFVRKQLKEAKQ
jgi:surfeit locus 1 family protein